jgi:hypothetical protein
MGLWDQSPPELLRWELHIKKRLIVDFVWICLHGFDTWYWWVGLWKMKIVPIPPDLPQSHQTANRVFFPYIGEVDLLGWISIPARIFNAYMLTYLCLDIFFVLVYSIQQRNMDRAIVPTKLKELMDQWLPQLEHPLQAPRLNAPSFSSPPDTETSSVTQGNEHLHVNPHSRSPSIKSNISKSSAHCESQISACSQEPSPSDFHRHKAKGKEVENCFGEEKDDGVPPSYRRPTRTGTDLLKRSLMRWSSNKELDHAVPPPAYTLYEPTFQHLYTASSLLTSVAPSTSKPRCFASLKKPLNYIVAIVKVFPALCTQPFRPSVLLAILSHGRNLGLGRSTTYPELLTRALRNPNYRSSNSRDIALASRILLTLHPPPRPPRWMRLGLGWSTFGVCSILVIGTELTIQWNYINGVQDLSSVGQLIPFCLGVGGLLKVTWAAVMEQDRREVDRWCYFGMCNAANRKVIWKEVSEGFQKCIDAYERQSVNSPVMTNDEKADV